MLKDKLIYYLVSYLNSILGDLLQIFVIHAYKDYLPWLSD